MNRVTYTVLLRTRAITKRRRFGLLHIYLDSTICGVSSESRWLHNLRSIDNLESPYLVAFHV